MRGKTLILGLLLVKVVQSQIIIDNTSPYDNPTWLVNNILLGGGIIATNHSFIGDPNQIGFFNGINSNIGIDSGIVLSSGSVLDLIGPNSSGSTSTMYSLPGDPTLDAVIFPDPTNDAAVLEFDFIPTSDTIRFKYVFGSEEYLEFVNSFNDAFGFFLSGPNPSGGNYVDQNLAIVPGTLNTAVTINNVNNVVNPTYYVDNGDGFTAPQNTDPTVVQFDGFTTPLTAIAHVNCGDSYHIKLVVADAVDWAYDSGIFLEAGSFYSPPLSISDGLGIDSTVMEIACNSTITLIADGGVGATYQWFDSTSTVFSTDQSVTVGAGEYIVSADILGCAKFSDTLIVIADDAPTFDLGPDYNIPCNTTTIIDPVVTGGLGIGFYQYDWNIAGNDTFIEVAEGIYILEVNDGTGCMHQDTIVITEDPIPNTTISGGGAVCDDGSTVAINFTFNGLLPWDLTYTNGSVASTIDDIDVPTYSISTTFAGNYAIVLAKDSNDCVANISVAGLQEVIINPLPIAVITPSDVIIYEGDEVELSVGTYMHYEWYTEYDSLISNEEIITVQDAGSYKVWVEDENGCTDTSELAIVRLVPLIQLFVPTVFTPNNDEHNELFVIKGLYIKDFNIKIFDRWGEQLFESEQIEKYWDGTFEKKKVQQGTYYYQIEILGQDGNNFTKTGTIEVLY